MRRLVILLIGLLSVATAQQSATLSGIIMSEEELPAGTRVAVHVVDNDNVWGQEVVSVVPVAGTFSITIRGEPSVLSPLRSGAVLLPGLQNEYLIAPESGINYAQGRLTMYVDGNDNLTFDRVADNVFIGITTLEEPIGFLSLLYVDYDATMSSTGVDLELRAGWNIFAVRFPGERPEYATQAFVDDAVLDVFLP